MIKTLIWWYFCIVGGLVGSLVVVELVRQGSEHQLGEESLITRGLQQTYDGLSQVTGYSIAPVYGFLYRFPKYVIR